ncbi:MAG TPA: PDZ domain-containing protein, partial [Prolixibacteraceae bacterium]|nr:PDZ domain-containing protein [Prolixibacteraceae bacterium]
STTNITNSSANDELPMWHENKIYYLSDNGNEKRFNIWEYDTETEKNKQITKFADFDVHFPSIGPKEIVFEAGGELYLLNLETEKHKKVDVNVIADKQAVLPQTVKAQKYMQNAGVSPNGNRVAVEARGDIFSLPAEKGYILNLNQSSGSAQRFPAWSPNGKTVAYWSDESGEYELTLYNVEKGTSKKVTTLGEGFRYNIYWSPDAQKIAFIDQAMKIQVTDIESGKTPVVDKGLWMYHGALNNFSVSWSPDSKWLTWSRGTDNRNSIVFIQNTESGEKVQITSDFYNNFQPTFDPEGKYLYLLTNRSMKPGYSDFDNSFVYDKSTMVAAISLKKDTPSPVEPENDKVELKDEKDSEEKEDKENGDEKEKEESKVKDVEIDFDELEKRLVLLPIDAGSYKNLAAANGKIVFQDVTNANGKDSKKPIVFWDLKERELKTIIENADGFSLSANNEKMLISDQGKLSIIELKEKQKAEKFVPLQEMEITVDPQKEWQQIFTDAWRMERDYFYDENMHGVDWDAVKKKYGKLVEQAASRDDVNFLIGEMIGEINASHTYRGGGDLEQPQQRNRGYLGVDWKIENGAYQIANIIEGAEWDAEVRSPLAEPGVEVEEGDYVLAVNGISLSTEKEPEAVLNGLGGKTVELTISKSAGGENSKKIVVKLLEDEQRLRHLEWIEQKRKRVEEATDGKVGYIYVRSTGIDGQNELARQFYGQWNKEGLIIDERFNSGGQIPDRFIEMLNRKPLAYWAVRDGHDWQWPPVANFGPKVMLINGWSGSGGDAFPDYFRKAELGPLMGSRTWGGLIGITGLPQLIDGGTVTAPTFRMYDPDGKWFREGHGVDPDIAVPEDHEKLAKGIDNQLQQAIDWINAELKKNPPEWPKHEPYEKR